MKIKSLAIGTLLACSSAACLSTDSKPEDKQDTTPNTKRPNILFIMADDHASQSISAYGSNRNETPSIDRIANEGMRFDNCFCTNSICTPSRACILTGKFSHRNGVRTWERLDGTQTTLQGELQKAGYYTAMVGKWHLSSVPTGFDYWQIFNGQGEYFDPFFRVRRDDMAPGSENGKQGLNNDNSREFRSKGYATDVVTDEALKILDKRPKDKPFMMLLWHKAPHRTWLPPKRFEEWLKDQKVPEPATLYDRYTTRWPAITAEMRMTDLRWGYDLKTKEKDIPKFKNESEEIAYRYQIYIKDYLRVIRALDENVGRTLDYLDKNGLTENTIVVYTSDQGFFLGENSWFDKRWMYDVSCKMPFLVRYPAKIKPGSHTDALVMNVDFAPTLLDMAGVKKPECMQGESFKTLLETNQEPENWRDCTYYHYYDGAEHHVAPHYGCRTKEYKLIYFPKTKGYVHVDGYMELFDLKKDPQELNNVAYDPAYAAVLADMKKNLQRMREKYGDKE